jgi:hypothetical protein
MSIAIIHSVVGPTETSGILEVGKRWMSGLNRFLLGMRNYRF